MSSDTITAPLNSHMHQYLSDNPLEKAYLTKNAINKSNYFFVPNHFNPSSSDKTTMCVAATTVCFLYGIR